jgi:3-hydroxyisobutyrate dehydrogenase-like beta-hydroxyacid dehydrogenase
VGGHEKRGAVAAPLLAALATRSAAVGKARSFQLLLLAFYYYLLLLVCSLVEAFPLR